jgi:beta-phosphoglucomutase-like phosphatase (HAD superfamily)
MTVDVEAGQAAGMTVWIVATGSDSWDNLQSSPAQRVFRSLTEVHEALSAAVA